MCVFLLNSLNSYLGWGAFLTGQMPQFSTRWCLNTNLTNRHTHTHTRADAHALSLTRYQYSTAALSHTHMQRAHKNKYAHTHTHAHNNYTQSRQRICKSHLTAPFYVHLIFTSFPSPFVVFSLPPWFSHQVWATRVSRYYIHLITPWLCSAFFQDVEQGLG